MREIKFRRYLKNGFGMQEEFTDSSMSFSNGKIKNCRGIVLMQYTGLKDKNGKEIYDGDIVIMNKNYIMEVVFKADVGYELGCMNNNDEVDVKIVGNIYQNPELLK